MVQSVQSSNPPTSGFAQASCQAAFLYKEEFYGQILHCILQEGWCPMMATLEAPTMAFTPVGDPQHRAADHSNRSFSQHRV